ncbi:MAG: beta-class carbonic anhydrase [Bacillota bacterium]
MSLLDEILAANKDFVVYRDKYRQADVSKVPQKQLAIFTCMDTRLVDFLEPAMGIKRGDAKIIKNAGNTLVDPQGGVIRSLVVAIFLLGVEEVLVIGHKDCGMANIDAPALIRKMKDRGISETLLDNMEPELLEWLGAFKDPVTNVVRVVDMIRNSPLIPKDIPVHGMIFDPRDGHLEVVSEGY